MAWAGTRASSADEWIELHNAGTEDVDLSGWSLQTETAPLISLHGIIAPGAYFLIERTDDTAISDIAADVFGPFGGSGLSNSFERLWLQDASGMAVDEVAQCFTENGAKKWCGGIASPEYASLERIRAVVPGIDRENWATNTGTVTTGIDASGDPVQGVIRGTPRYQNSVSQ